jgi:hypothetical protein
MSDDAEARRRRAARLREQIAGLTGRDAEAPATPDPTVPDPAAPDPAARRDAPRVRPASPRTLVEERMRELDRGEGETKH